jgi:hypothetical protein
MSGVLLTVAFYALLHFKAIADAALGPGFPRALLSAAGLPSLLLAASLLRAQWDYKRMLAYHSIEHMGLIALGAAAGSALAIAAVLLHILGHGLAKGVLLLASGEILLVEGTSDIDKVPALLSRRPALGGIFGAGLIALLGLPPFSLFASEVNMIRAEGRRRPRLGGGDRPGLHGGHLRRRDDARPPPPARRRAARRTAAGDTAGRHRFPRRGPGRLHPARGIGLAAAAAAARRGPGDREMTSAATGTSAGHGHRQTRQISTAELPAEAARLLGDGHRLALAAHDDQDQLRVVYTFCAGPPDRRAELEVRLNQAHPEVPSLAGQSFPGQPVRTRVPRPVRHLPSRAPVPAAPRPAPALAARMAPDAARRRADAHRCGPFPFVTVDGPGVYEIPVGPVHAGLIEPGHFRFSVVGETILKMKARLWFLHRGLERLFQGRDRRRGPAGRTRLG